MVVVKSGIMPPEIIREEDLNLARQTLIENERIETYYYYCSGANPHGHTIEVKIRLSITERVPKELLTCPWHPSKKPKLLK